MINKKERRLVWKYFWRQKVKEIVLFSLIVSAIIFIPFLLGHNIGDNHSEMCNWNSQSRHGDGKCSTIEQWVEGFFYLIAIVIILGLFFVWLGYNWEKAVKRVKEELKPNKTIK